VHPAGSIDDQRLAFAKRQKSGDMIHVGVGQHDADDGAVPRPVSRVERRRLNDLLTQVWRCVEQEPVLVINGNRQRGLGSGDCRGITRPRTTAVRTAAIPLGEAPSRGRSESGDPRVERGRLEAQPCGDVRGRYDLRFGRRGWQDEDLRQLAGENLLRAMREMEAVAVDLGKAETPSTLRFPGTG